MTAFLLLTAATALSGQAVKPRIAAAAAKVADAGEPIVLGRSYTIRSRVLGDVRRLNVWLPPSYDRGSARYPALVLLDGGVTEDFVHVAGLAQVTSAYGRGQEVIVVGVEGVDRRHDLSPRTDDPADLRFTKSPGGADSYRRFLAKEVKPWIAAHYRIDGRTALMGESMAGLFVLDTLATTPSAFTDYAAVSPILWWNRGAVAKALGDKAPATGSERRVFVAFEGSMAAGPTGPTPAQAAEALTDRSLRGRPDVTLVRFADEKHDTIYHPAALAAFRALYAVEKVQP